MVFFICIRFPYNYEAKVIVKPEYRRNIIVFKESGFYCRFTKMAFEGLNHNFASTVQKAINNMMSRISRVLKRYCLTYTIRHT